MTPFAALGAHRSVKLDAPRGAAVRSRGLETRATRTPGATFPLCATREARGEQAAVDTTEVACMSFCVRTVSRYVRPHVRPQTVYRCVQVRPANDPFL